jgi:hypothetical protein
MKRASEILTPLYLTKYGKVYDVIERFVKKNNLRLYGLLALSKQYDKTTIHAPHYGYKITCRNPVIFANNLTNELHKEGFNVVLQTVFLFQEYSIEFEYYVRFPIVTFTSTRYNNLTFIYWTLSDPTLSDMWDLVLEYEKKVEKPSAKRVVAKLPERFPLDTFKNYVVLGELAYYLKHKSILLETSLSKPIFTALTFDDGERPMQFFKYSVIEHQHYTIILYNVLRYIPVLVEEVIDGFKIANSNIILYFLAVNNQNQYMREFQAKKIICDDESKFVGRYVRPFNNKKAPTYNPKIHLLEHNKYREMH